MTFLPREGDYIDIHSHRSEMPEGVFRLYNIFLDDYTGKGSAHQPVSLGFHPWHIVKSTQVGVIGKKLKEYAGHPNILALGECGLDKIIKADPEVQEEIFIKHIEVSEEHKKPLILHCVKAYHELIHLRKSMNVAQPWIVHGFNSSAQMADQLMAAGMYISIGERLLRKEKKSDELLRILPLDRIFIETDDDDRDIEEMYEEVAGRREEEIGPLRTGIYRNFQTVFNP